MELTREPEPRKLNQGAEGPVGGLEALVFRLRVLGLSGFSSGSAVELAPHNQG